MYNRLQLEGAQIDEGTYFEERVISEKGEVLDKWRGK